MREFKIIEPIEIYFLRDNRKYLIELLNHIGTNTTINYPKKGKGFKIDHLVVSDRIWINPQELDQSKCSDSLINCFVQIQNLNLDKVQSKQLLIEFIKSQF